MILESFQGAAQNVLDGTEPSLAMTLPWVNIKSKTESTGILLSMALYSREKEKRSNYGVLGKKLISEYFWPIFPSHFFNPGLGLESKYKDKCFRCKIVCMNHY